MDSFSHVYYTWESTVDGTEEGKDQLLQIYYKVKAQVNDSIFCLSSF